MMLTIKAITSIEEFSTLRDEWNNALAKSSMDNVHLTWEWFYAWCSNFAQKGLYIIIVKDAGNILAIAPFIKKNTRILGFPVKKISALRNFYSPYFNIILAEREKECMEAIFKYLMAQEWDVIELGDILLESMTVRELEGLAEKGLFRAYIGKPKGMSLYIPISGSWESYYRTLSKQFRSNIKYEEKKLGKLGKVSLVEIRDSVDLDKYLDKFFRIERCGWKGEKGTAIACSNESKGFYTDLARLASQKGWFSLFFLKVDDKEIAGKYCLRRKGVMSLEKMGYDSDYARYSPGSLLQKKVLEQIFCNGFVKYDLLGTCENWKKKWASNVNDFAQVNIYRKNIYAGFIFCLEMCSKAYRKFLR